MTIKCGCCGSNYTIIGKTYYGCARHRDRGIVACSNDITVKKDIVEDVLLKGIKDGLFSDEATKELLRDCNAMMSEIEASHAQERKELEKRVKQLEVELRNLLGFIKAGTVLPSIVDEIKHAKDEKRRLEILLRNTNPATTEITNLVPCALERYREAVEHLGNITTEQVAEARERLKEITGGKILLKPFDGDGLIAEVHGNYASLIASSSIMLVAGARYAANPTVYH